MAIRYDATADYLEFVSGPTGAVTVGGWFQVLGSLKFSSCITFSNLAPGSNAGTASGASMIDTNGSLGGYIASARDLGIDVATGDWFFLAVSRSGAGDDVATEWRLHGSTLTGALQSIGPYSGYNYMPGNRIQIATSPYAATYSEHLDGASGPIWVFDSVLSAAQIDLLRRRLVPPIVPWAWIPGIWPGSDRVKDFSGNGRNFTPAGTLADVDGPPIPWGAQIIVPEYALAAVVSAADSGSASDTASSTMATSLSATDSAAASEAVSANLAATTAGTDAAAAADSVGNSAALVSSASDGGVASDATQAAVTLTQAFSDAAAGSEAAQGATTINESAAETVAAADQVASTLQATDEAVETAEVSDSAVALAQASVAAADQASASDSAAAAVVVGVALLEAAAADEVAAAALAAAAEAIDAAAATDDVQAEPSGQVFDELLDDACSALDQVGASAVLGELVPELAACADLVLVYGGSFVTAAGSRGGERVAVMPAARTNEQVDALRERARVDRRNKQQAARIAGQTARRGN